MTRPRSSSLANRLLRWFAKHKRDLPWREEPRNPYHVWLSEIMLQQTQVATVIPYYERWLQRFPTLKDFAKAPLDDALKLWEGLGYYARARNFHKAAQAVMRDCGGQIPQTVDELMKLPGIGRYTAGAIASLAFNQDAPVLDGNVKRVLSRIFALTTDDGRRTSNDDLWQVAESLLPKGCAGQFNEALMDLGATTCTPRSPNCPACPLRSLCGAYANGNPEAYPAKPEKKTLPHRRFGTAVIVSDGDRVLMGQRPRDGLLGGLWEFVSGEFQMTSHESRVTSHEKLKVELRRIVAEKTGLKIKMAHAEYLGLVNHGFTHFKMTRHVWLVRVETRHGASLRSNDYDQLRWASIKQLSQLALTRSDQKILQLYETHRLNLHRETHQSAQYLDR